MKSLQAWFLETRRSLPWRASPTPYAVWVSEVMLQQTQVSVVIPYFNRWMDRFPSVAALAAAGEAEVIKLWEGLGYYSRARNLHAGARQIVQEHGGEIPSCPNALAKIKGVGPYTVGAIRSFAFHERAAAVDGNVIRVVSRYLGIEGDISKPATVQAIRGATLELLPEERSWEVMEGLIELGATICTKRPKCERCPIRSSCRQATHLPFNSKKQTITKLTRVVAVMIHEEAVLVRQVPPGKVMAGLWEFPYFEVESPSLEALRERLPFPVKPIMAMDPVTHTFTRYHATLHPYVVEVEERAELEGAQWVPLCELEQLPFSAGHRKVRVCFASFSPA